MSVFTLREPIGPLLRVGLLAGVTASCAHVEPPPGGPQDRTPPSVASTSPEDEAVVSSYDGPVVFRFDERISERGVEEAVIVSPRTSPVSVSAGRSEIRVSLRDGWQRDVVYQITIRPEVRDLFGNPIAAPVQLVFSTGPAIPETRVVGTVRVRVTGQPAADHRVEAIRMVDSLVYAVATGRAGEFELSRLPVGDYLFRAFEDVNRNRSLEEYEPRDSLSATVAEGQPMELELRVVTPDSTAPRITRVEPSDSVVEIEFDDYLDPSQPVEPSQIAITDPQGVALAVASVRIGIGSNVAAAAPDTALATRDTLAADTADEPLPSRRIRVRLAEGAVLQTGVEYTVRVARIRNVVGVSGDAEGTLEE